MMRSLHLKRKTKPFSTGPAVIITKSFSALNDFLPVFLLAFFLILYLYFVFVRISLDVSYFDGLFFGFFNSLSGCLSPNKTTDACFFCPQLEMLVFLVSTYNFGREGSTLFFCSNILHLGQA